VDKAVLFVAPRKCIDSGFHGGCKPTHCATIFRGNVVVAVAGTAVDHGDNIIAVAAKHAQGTTVILFVSRCFPLLFDLPLVLQVLFLFVVVSFFHQDWHLRRTTRKAVLSILSRIPC
jgi:hypothetical protein